MIKLSERANLAIHALGYMAANRGNEPFPVVELATGLGASQSHLAKVMQVLVKQGLLTSSRGAKGGFSFGMPPCEITLLHVYEAVEGPVACPGCLLPKSLCPGEGCVLQKTFSEMTAALKKNFSNISICAFDVIHSHQIAEEKV